MTSGKNNSDISTCQCDTNPEGHEDEWKKGGLVPHNALVQWRISMMTNVAVTRQCSQSGRQLLYNGLTLRQNLYTYKPRKTGYEVILYHSDRLFVYLLTLCVVALFAFRTTAHSPPPPPQWARTSSFTRFLDHTQRSTTVGRIPLDEWSARRRDLYLTTHKTYNKQTPMPTVGFESTVSAGERPQTYVLDRAAIGTVRGQYDYF